MPKQVLFENEMYEVLLDKDKYLVVNKDTRVVEGETQSFPDALTTAIMSKNMVDAVMAQERGEEVETPNFVFNH